MLGRVVLSWEDPMPEEGEQAPGSGKRPSML
jgi:hypothetical protein